MFDRSIIKTSGQMPKLVLLFAVLIGGWIAMVIGLKNLEGSGWGFPLALAGMSIGLASFLLALLFIRCPRCGSRWLWKAVSQQEHSQWLSTLLSNSTCPSCAYTPNRESQVAGG